MLRRDVLRRRDGQGEDRRLGQWARSGMLEAGVSRAKHQLP
jgi:hypothetical protein